MFDWPSDGQLLVPGVKNEEKSVTLLAGKKKLNARKTAEGLVISLPSAAPDRISSTVVLRVKGPLHVD